MENFLGVKLILLSLSDVCCSSEQLWWFLLNVLIQLWWVPYPYLATMNQLINKTEKNSPPWKEQPATKTQWQERIARKKGTGLRNPEAVGLLVSGNISSAKKEEEVDLFWMESNLSRRVHCVTMRWGDNPDWSVIAREANTSANTRVWSFGVFSQGRCICSVEYS